MDALHTSCEVLKLPFRHKDDSRSSIQIPTPRMTSREIDYTTPRVLKHPIGDPYEQLPTDTETENETMDLESRHYQLLIPNDGMQDEEYDYEFAEFNQFCQDTYNKWKKIKKKETQLEVLLSYRSQLKSGKAISEKQKQNMIKAVKELETKEKRLRLARTVVYEDGKLKIDKKKVNFLTLRRKRVNLKSSFEAINRLLININGILDRGDKKFIDKNNERVSLLNVLEVITGTQAGRLVLDYTDEKLKSKFTIKYSDLKQWNKAKKKIGGTIHFYHENHILIDTLTGMISQFQNSEVTNLIKRREYRSLVVDEQFANDLLMKMGQNEFLKQADEFIKKAIEFLRKEYGLLKKAIEFLKKENEFLKQANELLKQIGLEKIQAGDSVEACIAVVENLIKKLRSSFTPNEELANVLLKIGANAFLKRMGLEQIYAGFSKETCINVVKELIIKPGCLLIPTDPGYSEISIAKDAFIKLKEEHIKEFKKLEENLYSYVKDHEMADAFTKIVMDAGKLYLAIRSSLFFILNRVMYYYEFESKKREELLDNFKQAMPTGGDFDNQKAWKWKEVHKIFADIKIELFSKKL